MTTSTFLAASAPWTAGPRPARGRRLGEVERLNREWRLLDGDPSALSRARSWGLTRDRALDRLDALLARAGYGTAPDDEIGDRVLASLVLLARGDDLAARIVLQRILPGLVRIAMRRGRIVAGGPVAAFGDLASVAWEVIRGYPIERRSQRVAANLLRDIEYQTFVRSRRRRSREVYVPDVEVELGEEHGVEDDLDPGARMEWGQLLDWATRRGVAAVHLDLLRRLAAGGSSSEIAQALRCTDRTIRNRRQVAIDEVRRAYAEVAA